MTPSAAPAIDWEAKWATGSTGWDQTFVHPALRVILEDSSLESLGIPRDGKAVVPGCGRGYDVDLFARRGLNAVGLDISPTGVEEAKEWLRSQPQDGTSGTVEIVCADVLAYAKGESNKHFDLILDYTFLCALPPDLRPQWATAMSDLARQNARTRLITIMFPLFDTIAEGNRNKGPPFPLTEQAYHDLLDEQWELVHIARVPEETRRQKGPPGGEKLAVWRLRL